VERQPPVRLREGRIRAGRRLRRGHQAQRTEPARIADP
jgi:hypothetical protein